MIWMSHYVLPLFVEVSALPYLIAMLVNIIFPMKKGIRYAHVTNKMETTYDDTVVYDSPAESGVPVLGIKHCKDVLIIFLIIAQNLT